MKKTVTVHQQRKVFGHRKRLRNRFLKSGFDGFLDYEIVELLLTLGTPRKDCKQMAKQAIKIFGGLQGVLDATIEDLWKIKGIGKYNAFGVKLFQEVAQRYDKEKISKKVSLTNPKLVAVYIRRKIGKKKKEHLIAIYVDARNRLLEAKVISIGTLTANLIHPRELFTPAFLLHAAGVIIVHNHPSGDPQPSKEDIRITKIIKEAGQILGIHLLDHLIVTNTSFVSLKESGFL